MFLSVVEGSSLCTHMFGQVWAFGVHIIPDRKQKEMWSVITSSCWFVCLSVRMQVSVKSVHQKKQRREKIPWLEIKLAQWSEKYRAKIKTRCIFIFRQMFLHLGEVLVGKGSIKTYSFFHNMSDVPGLICMWIRSNECEGNGAYAMS